MKPVFLLKYTLRLFTALIFTNKIMVYRNNLLEKKNSFSENYVKLIGLHVIHT